MSRPDGLALAGSVFLPGGSEGEAMVLTYHSPRTTVFEVLPSTRPESVVAALGRRVEMDATIVAAGRESDAVVAEFSAVLPGADCLTFDPVEVHRFLFAYLDRHDPMALGHASDRVLFDETYFRAGPPSYRGGRRGDRRTAIDAALALLRTMGNAVGLEPPFPRTPEKRNAWGLGRLAALADLTFGLIAALLFRWGSPLARVRQSEGGRPELVLADRWLRDQSEQRPA